MSDASFQVGDRIRVVTLPPYLKSAENMPMLRPPDLIEVGEEGLVLSRQPGGYLGIRFSRGDFLIDAQYLTAAEASEASNGADEAVEA